MSRVPIDERLSRRERQIMDILFRRRVATAAQVRSELPDAPSYSAVRALLSKLEQKGAIRHQVDGPRYVFVPAIPRERARRSALERLVATFFDGSPVEAASALLGMSAEDLPEDELERLDALVRRARRRS